MIWNLFKWVDEQKQKIEPWQRICKALEINNDSNKYTQSIEQWQGLVNQADFAKNRLTLFECIGHAVYFGGPESGKAATKVVSMIVKSLNGPGLTDTTTVKQPAGEVMTWATYFLTTISDQPKIFVFMRDYASIRKVIEIASNESIWSHYPWEGRNFGKLLSSLLSIDATKPNKTEKSIKERAKATKTAERTKGYHAATAKAVPATAIAAPVAAVRRDLAERERGGGTGGGAAALDDDSKTLRDAAPTLKDDDVPPPPPVRIVVESVPDVTVENEEVEMTEQKDNAE